MNESDAPYEGVPFDRADYSAILKKDSRYDSRAYDFVLETVRIACENSDGRASGTEILDVFRDLALDEYGPMAFAVLCDWGLRSCEDVGNVIFNLAEEKFIGRNNGDSRSDFMSGYDFHEEFLGPYEV